MHTGRIKVIAPVLIFTAGVLLLAGAYFELNQTIREIKASGNVYLSGEEILQLSGLKTGTRPGDAGLQRARQRLESHPVISSASVGWERNGILHIKVTEAQCAAVIKSGDHLYDCTSSLQILSEGSVRCTGVPLVSGIFRRDGRKFTDIRLQAVFTRWDILMKRYPGLFSRISEIRIGNDGRMNVYLTMPKFRIEMNISLNEEDLYRLQNTLSYLEKAGLESGIADLRGKDAVIIPDKR